MMSLKLCETKKLHYGKYLYKLVLANRLNHIFRSELQKNSKLDFAKAQLDTLTEVYNRGEPMVEYRFRATREIDFDTYFDAIDVYESLLTIDDYKVRVDPYQSLTIYSNDRASLVNIANKLRTGVREFWEPSPDSIDLLLKEENIIIVNEPTDFEYRVTLGRQRNSKTEDLANWLVNNTDKSKVGPIALDELQRNGWVDGLYFYVRDQKVLMIVQMIAGTKIRRIDKIVYKGDLDKY